MLFFATSLTHSMVHFEFNGAKHQVDASTNIRSLLLQSKIETRFCAVEVNEEILPKNQYDSYCVREGDRIEVVTLVGGG